MSRDNPSRIDKDTINGGVPFTTGMVGGASMERMVEGILYADKNADSAKSDVDKALGIVDEALDIALGIDGKATQALEESGVALGIAQSMDGRLAQAEADSSQAKTDAGFAVSETERLEEFIIEETKRIEEFTVEETKRLEELIGEGGTVVTVGGAPQTEWDADTKLDHTVGEIREFGRLLTTQEEGNLKVIPMAGQEVPNESPFEKLYTFLMHGASPSESQALIIDSAPSITFDRAAASPNGKIYFPISNGAWVFNPATQLFREISGMTGISFQRGVSHGNKMYYFAQVGTVFIINTETDNFITRTATTGFGSFTPYDTIISGDFLYIGGQDSITRVNLHTDAIQTLNLNSMSSDAPRDPVDAGNGKILWSFGGLTSASAYILNIAGGAFSARRIQSSEFTFFDGVNNLSRVTMFQAPKVLVGNHIYGSHVDNREMDGNRFIRWNINTEQLELLGARNDFERHGTIIATHGNFIYYNGRGRGTTFATSTRRRFDTNNPNQNPQPIPGDVARDTSNDSVIKIDNHVFIGSGTAFANVLHLNLQTNSISLLGGLPNRVHLNPIALNKDVYWMTLSSVATPSLSFINADTLQVGQTSGLPNRSHTRGLVSRARLYLATSPAATQLAIILLQGGNILPNRPNMYINY